MTTSSHLFFALVGPSGAGKNTLIDALKAETDNDNNSPDFNLLTTATTRAIRDGETAGIHHYFLTENDFEKRLKNGDFLEHSAPHGRHYGTLKQEFIAQLKLSHLIKDIDWTGAHAIRQKMPKKTYAILVLPPSKDALEKRLNKRGASGKARLQTIDAAAADIHTSIWFHKKEFISEDLKGSNRDDYDFVIYNEDIDKAVLQLAGFIADKISKNKK